MNEVEISDVLYNEMIDYLVEELCSSWHPEKPTAARRYEKERDIG